MLDFCRPWHTSWLWIWSERSVGCSTWNRVLGSCGGAAAHGPDVRAAGGVGGPPGRDARIFGERDVGRFMWTRLADPRPAGPWMFVGSKYSDTAGPVRRIVQRGAGCLDLGWLTVETERLVWAGAGRGMFHVEPDGLVDTPQQGGRMFHVEQRRAAPGEPLSDRTADGPRFRGREVGAAPESGYHQG